MALLEDIPGTQGRVCEKAAVPDNGSGGDGLLPCHPSGKHSPTPARLSVPRPSPCFGKGTPCPTAVMVQGVPVLEAVVLVALVTDHLHHLLLLAARLQTLVGEDLKDDIAVVKRRMCCGAGAVPSLHARPWALTSLPHQCISCKALNFVSEYWLSLDSSLVIHWCFSLHRQGSPQSQNAQQEKECLAQGLLPSMPVQWGQPRAFQLLLGWIPAGPAPCSSFISWQDGVANCRLHFPNSSIQFPILVSQVAAQPHSITTLVSDCLHKALRMRTPPAHQPSLASACVNRDSTGQG